MTSKDYCYDIITSLATSSIDKQLILSHIDTLFRDKKKFGEYAFDTTEKLPIDVGVALISNYHKQVCLDIKTRASALKKRIKKILTMISLNDLIINKDLKLKKPVDSLECNLDRFKSGKGEKHWNSLEHNGPYFKHLDPFAKPIERLNVSLLYDNKPYNLNAKEEEVAALYARRIITEETGKKKFIKKDEFNTNFFNDFKTYLTAEHRKIFKDFKKLNFSLLVKKIKEIKEAKEEEKRIRREEKKLQQEKDKAAEKAFYKISSNKGKKYIKKETEKEKNIELEKKEERIKIFEKKLNYSFAFVDGIKKNIRNSAVEMPGIYVGQGDIIGKFKGRIKHYYYPEDITINVTKGKVPTPPTGLDGKKHKWGEVVYDNKANWTARYRDKFTDKYKYILLAETGDLLKFEKARKLNMHIEEVDKRISSLLRSKNRKDNQIGCVLYLIKEYGIRVGNEKEDEDDDKDKSEKVVGATTLMVQNVSCKIDKNEYYLVLSFKGKDSVSYDDTLHVNEIIYKLVEKFLKGKKASDNVFEDITSNDVNKYLKSIDKDFSAKVFRTRLASSIMYDGLKELEYDEDDVSDERKIRDFKEINKRVAIKLNHKKGLTDAAKAKLEKDKEIIKELKKAIKTETNAKKKDKLKKELISKEEKLNERDEMKEIALNTSLKNYIDPRIVKAWAEQVNLGGCKNDDENDDSDNENDSDDEDEKIIKHCVDKIYSKAELHHFRWSIEDDNFNEDWDYKNTELDCIVGNKLQPEIDNGSSNVEKKTTKVPTKNNTTKPKPSVKLSVQSFLLKLDTGTDSFKKCIIKIAKEFDVKEKTVLNHFYKLRSGK